MDVTIQPMIEMNGGGTSETKTRNQYLAAVCVAFGAVCAGTALAWTSPVLPQLTVQPPTNTTTNTTANDNSVTGSITFANGTTTEYSNITNAQTETPKFILGESEASLVGAMLAIGALVAALPAGFVADKFGRKAANLCLVVPFTINWLLIIFATGPTMLYIARFFAGIGTGAICVTAPMYIGEIADVSIRGTLGSFFQLFLCVGILLTYFVGALTTWVGLSIVLAVVPFVFVIAFFFMPESPVYLVKKGKLKDAGNSLKFLRGRRYNVQTELKIIQSDIEKAEAKSAGIKDLVASKGNRKALTSSLGLMLFQQLSGINAVIFYTVPIFKSSGSSLPPDLAAIIVSVVQVVIAYIAAMITDKANRRFFLIISSSGMFICLIALAFYFHLKELGISYSGLGILPLASLVLFIISFSLGFGPLPWMIMGELFAPEIKGVASGLAVMCNWALVFLVTFSFPIMNSSFGGHVTFYIFGVVVLISIPFVYYVVPETRGKSLQEIQSELNN